MPGAHRVLQFGPATYEVSAPVTGGQLVEPDTDPENVGKVKPAAAGSTAVLGVATADAQPAGTNPDDPSLNVAWAQKLVAVGYGPGEYRLTFDGAANFGEPLGAAADGQVTNGGGVAPTGAAIVGICTEPGGVESGKTGRVRLRV